MIQPPSTIQKELTILKEQVSMAQIMRDTAFQIVKDFELIGENIYFSENSQSSYEELFNEVMHTVSELARKPIGKLSQLCYVIDLKESKVFEASQQTNDSFEFTLAKLIVEREFVKVVYRTYFRLNS